MEQPRLIEGGLFIDDRGYLSFFNDFPNIKRMYVVENRTPHFVRAWHGHEREGKYMISLHGEFLVGVVPLDAPPKESEVRKFVLSNRKPQMLYIPPGHYNGLMNIQPDAKLLVFSTSTLAESMGDDKRLNWNRWDIWKMEDYR